MTLKREIRAFGCSNYSFRLKGTAAALLNKYVVTTHKNIEQQNTVEYYFYELQIRQPYRNNILILVNISKKKKATQFKQ